MDIDFACFCKKSPWCSVSCYSSCHLWWVFWSPFSAFRFILVASSNRKKLDSAPFSCGGNHDSAFLWEKLLCLLSFLQVDLGWFYTVNPNTEGELGIICLLLFRLLISDKCVIIMFLLGITQLKDCKIVAGYLLLMVL